MVPGAEPEVLREYRHLLRTASSDWQETAHRHALWALGPRLRGLLAELQRLLLAGTRLGRDDVHALARLVVLAERRKPRILLDGLPGDLATAGRGRRAQPDRADAGRRPRALGRRGPERPPEPGPDPDHHQRWFEQWATPGAAGELSVFLHPYRRRRTH